MGLETREEFLVEWGKVAGGLFGEEQAAAKAEEIEVTGNLLYTARVVAYRVAEEGLNLTIHRYFHGLASAQMNFLLQLPLGDMLAFVVGEYMFHQGFVAGMAYERGALVSLEVGLGDEDDAKHCLEGRDNINRTREELEQHLMPSPVEALQELQKGLRAMTERGEEEGGEGAPIIPPENNVQDEGKYW